MWELDYKESWAPKNRCFWTVVLEKTLESPLDCKIIKPVHPKGNQSWIFIGRADAKLKLQYFGHLMQRTDSLENTLMLGKIEGRRRRGYSGWDGWMASPTRWTWVWASFRSWRWTGKPGVQQSTGSQRVRHNWATELNWPPMRGSDLSSWEQRSPLLTSPAFSLIFLYLQQIQVKMCHELCWNLLYQYRGPLVRTGGFKQ